MISDYRFVSEREAVDWNFIVTALQGTYMGQGRSRDAIIQSCKGSLCFGVLSRSLSSQIAFARVITDGVTYAYLADVVVHATFRRRKAGSFLIRSILDQPRFKGIVFHLHTFQAQTFYARFGFEPVATMCTRPMGS